MPKRFYTLQPKKKAVIAVWEPGQVPSLWNKPKVYTPHSFARLCLHEEPVYVPWRVVELLSQHVETKEPEEDAETWPLDMKPNV